MTAGTKVYEDCFNKILIGYIIIDI